MKVKASSNFWRVPSQMNLHFSDVEVGLEHLGVSRRTAELMPSQATTRS
jgi:hypothetical protein